MKNADYWKKRFEILEESAVSKGASYYESLEKEYREASRRIESEISTWYTRFATNNGISLAEARKLLNSSELAEFRWTVQDYIKFGEENALNGQWMKQLENASAKVHISRLEALKVQMQQQIEVLYGNQTDGIDALARRIYSDGYYHTAFEIQRGFNVGWDLQGLNERQLERVLSKPWTADNQTFRDKCWKQKTELVSTVSTELTQAIMRGDSPDKAIKTISEKFNVAKNKAGRLLMTESAYFASEAQKNCFNELDVEKFEIVATLDSHTSELCQSLDGQVFDMKDYQAGVTAPPFHPWCRTTTVPYFEDNFTERAARDAEGNTYYVPSTMTYKDWKKTFVNGGSKGDLKKVDVSDIIDSVEHCKNFAELKSYMNKQYGIDVSDSVNNLDYTSVNEGLQGVEHIIKEFPQAKDSFTSIGVSKSGLMCAGYDGDINFNPGYFTTREKALAAHGNTTFHPKGNNIFGSGCHEAGHILEKALISKNSNSMLGIIAWNDYTYAKAIVSDACKIAKKLPECKGMVNAQLKGAISGYAKTNASECLAEAVCDYSLNGESASPLSKIIWDILKKELG